MRQDGDWHGIFGQRFSADGSRVGGEFQVNTYTPDQQEGPAVAMNATGDFVVVWQSAIQDAGGVGVFAQCFDADGAPRGPELPVNTYAPGEQTSPAVALCDNGTFLVVWESAGQDGDGGGIFAQAFRLRPISVLKATVSALKRRFR